MHFPIYGTHDQATIDQMGRCIDAHSSAVAAALMADGHKGYAQPVGGVIAYQDAISISGVGFDIACGNLAIRTDAHADDVRFRIGSIMDDVFAQVSFGIGRHNNTRVDHELFDDPAWSQPNLAPLKEMARAQLGTVGSGNHYVDIFVDEVGRVWVGVHFGSRGLGHKTATHFLKAAGGTDGMDVPPTVVSTNDQIGQDYLQAMALCGRYAYAGREWVARHVVRNILGAEIVEEVHNHHNYAWNEVHSGLGTSSHGGVWVVRKGATPAFPGQKGFIGGSMGDDAVIIEGVHSDDSVRALYSTVHGAGRVMSRTAAKGKFHRKTGEQISQGAVKRDEMQSWLLEKGVTLRGADLDEAPQAYRRLPEVLAAHEGTIRILHTLRPIGVAMAGSDIVDPFKD